MINYRLATNDDNQQLIELTASSGMSGEISLRIQRQPDFFRLLRMRGQSRVFVAVEDNTIVGCLSVSIQKVYVGGEVFPLQYIGDLKVTASLRNKGIGLQLCNELANYVIGQGADLAFLNVSKGNKKPFSFFKDRPNIPDFENIGVFNIHQFVGRKSKTVDPVYPIESVTENDELIQFLKSHYCKYELGPVITRENLEGTEAYIIRRDKQIIAAICLLDTMGSKQNVVTRLPWKLKYLLKCMNAVYRVSGISKMPAVNEPVRIIYIKYIAVNNCDKEATKLLINHARNIVYERFYSFASIGLHEKDPMNTALAGIFKLSFKSVGMLLSIKNNKVLIEKVKQGIPFEDYSLV